jgi:hypothetical protein
MQRAALARAARSTAGPSRRGVVAVALVVVSVLAGGVARAAVPLPFGDVFDRGNGSLGSPWTNTSGWAIDDGRVKLTSNGTHETVVDTGLSDGYRVAVDISLSPSRANAGLSTLWRNHSNHLFCKIEVTPRNPGGLMSIGHQLHGRNVSLLKSAKGFGLDRGRTYRLSITKHGRAIDCTITGNGINGGSRTITYTLSSAEVSSFGSATRSGLRGKNLNDEDDGQTRYDKFIVRAI